MLNVFIVAFNWNGHEGKQNWGLKLFIEMSNTKTHFKEFKTCQYFEKPLFHDR